MATKFQKGDIVISIKSKTIVTVVNAGTYYFSGIVTYTPNERCYVGEYKRN